MFLRAVGLTMAMILIGCTKPRPDSVDRDLHFAMTTEDIKVIVRPNEPVKAKSPEGIVSSSALFHHIYVMQMLGEKTAKTTWAADSQEQLLQLYRLPGAYTRSNFGASPYAEFLIANSKDAFSDKIGGIDDVFDGEMRKIVALIDNLKSTYPFPKEPLSVSGAFRAMSEFISFTETRINKSDLSQPFKEGIISGIYENFWLKLPGAERTIQQFENSPDLESSVAILRGFVSSMDIKLSPDIEGKLTAASSIGGMLNKPEMSERDAFAILIELWDQLTDEEREKTFGEVSPSLYDYLSSKNVKQRDCLKRDDCRRLMLNIAKKFVILPEIRDYGVNNLQAQIEASAVKELVEQTGQVATEFVASLPDILLEEISKQMEAEKTKLKGYQENYDSFVRGEIQTWYESRFGAETLPALERGRIGVYPKGKEFRFVAGPEGEVQVSAEGLGDALLASHQLLKKPRAKSLKGDVTDAQLMSLTRINQMLAHGGFLKADGQSFASLSRAMSLNKLEPLNIQKGLDLQYLFTMPENVFIERGFELPMNAIPKDFSIAVQAKLLNGFTRMTEVFKDWTHAPMDGLLGDVEAAELLQSLTADELKVPAFPKDAFLAVALGNASSVLANLKAKGSPLMIVCVDGKIIWGDEDATCSKPSALAALASVGNYQRQHNISTLEQALFLEAIVQYLQSADELSKKTKSAYLTERDGAGESPIETMKKALPDLRNLAMAITNMLVSRLQDSGGRFFKTYDIDTHTPSSELAGLDDHLRIMDGLLAAAEFFNIPPYQRASVRAYHALNNCFYDPDIQFYIEGNGQVTTMRLAQALYTVPRVTPYLRESSSVLQLRQMVTLWQDSLRGRKL